MKAKQLETIKTKHNRFLSFGERNKPDYETEDIKYAILNGHPPKVKKMPEIQAALRRKLISDRCHSIYYSDVFEVPKDGKMAEWLKEEAKRLKKIEAYKAEVDPVLTKAELHDDSDADEVMDKIVASAKKHGIYH